MNNLNDADRNNKRSKPEHDSSYEEEQEALKKTKVIEIPATTHTSGGEKPISDGDMEELKQMLAVISKDIKEVKVQLENTNQEMREMKTELKKTNQKVDEMNLEMEAMREGWKKEKNTLVNELHKTQKRLEFLEREKIRNNLVISGIEIDTGDREVLKASAENLLKRDVKIDTTIKTAYKVGPKKCVIEMNSWEDKMKILRGKSVLKGKQIYIEPEMTVKEREIQKIIRDTARKEREGGARVKVGFQKLEVNGKTLTWNYGEQRLTEPNTSKQKN